LELTTGHDNPITLSFNVGTTQGPKAVEGKTVVKKQEAIDMVSGPGGIHIPIPTKEK
jgi:hypothetical protein